MRKVLVSGVMVGLLMMVMTGCPKTQITNLPTNVSQDEVQAWYAATGAVKMIAQSTKGLTDSVVKVNSLDPKLISPSDYQNILLVLGKTAQAGIQVDSVLRQAPSNFGQGTKQQILAEIQPIVAQLQQADLDGLLSKSQSPQLQAELATAKTLTQSAQLLLTLAK